MSDIISARIAHPVAPPPLTVTMRCALLRGMRAGLRRDRYLLARLTKAGELHDHIARRIARAEADLAELEGL